MTPFFRRFASRALAPASLLLPGAAFAHAGAAPEAIEPLVRPGDAAGLALEASFGLLDSPDGEEFRWVCHETIVTPGAYLTPQYSRNADGVLLSTIEVLLQGQDPQESVYRSADGGCTWTVPAGLTNRVVTDLAFSPTERALAFAVTGNLSVGAENAVFRSEDTADTFAAASPLSDGRVYRSLAVTAGEQPVVWATAAWFDPLGAWITVSSDGGDTWQDRAVDFRPEGGLEVLLDLLALSADGSTAWIRVDGPAADYVLKATEGGAQLDQVFETAGVVLGATVDDEGGVWIVSDEEGLLHAADGVAFAAVEGAPVVRGVRWSSRGLLLAADVTEEAAALYGYDGQSFSPLFEWSALAGPLECPEGSASRTYCDPSWSLVADSLGLLGDDDDDFGDDDDDAGDDDAGDDDDAEGCAGCGSSMGSGPGGWALLPVLVLFRRRRTGP